jgi:hypothetical protein
LYHHLRFCCAGSARFVAKEDSMSCLQKTVFASLAFVALCLAASPTMADPVVGQINNFEDGTTQGWIISIGPFNPTPPFPPANVPTGGPAGVGDNYLRLTSTGIGGPPPNPNSRMAVINTSSQWTGNYLAAGVNAITLDVINLGATDLHLRLLFEDPMFGPPQNEAFSTNPVVLSVGGGWTSVTFLINPGDLTAGMGTVQGALTNTTAIRIFHSPQAGFPGPPVAAQLGVDNIRAAAIPEPTTMLLLGTGLAGVAAKVHRRRKQ